MDGNRAFEDERAGLGALGTKELVDELIKHGRGLIEAEVRSLRAELSADLTRLKADARHSATTLEHEAREQLSRGVNALRADVGEQGRRAGEAARPMAIGGVLAHAGILMLAAALAVGLAAWMPLWASAAIVGVALAAIGGGLLAAGKKKLETVGKGALQRTNQQLRESRRWMDSSKEIVAGKVRDWKQMLSAVEWPRLRASSGGARTRIGSGSRLGAQ